MKECLAKTGKAPISVRWVDTDKGGEYQMDVRSSLVARDFKVKGGTDQDDLFASTPPLAALRVLPSKAATTIRCEKGALESTVHGGFIHRIAERSRRPRGYMRQAEVLLVRMPTSGPSLGRVLCNQDDGRGFQTRCGRPRRILP